MRIIKGRQYSLPLLSHEYHHFTHFTLISCHYSRPQGYVTSTLLVIICAIKMQPEATWYLKHCFSLALNASFVCW